jgi:hypothetical protein
MCDTTRNVSFVIRHPHNCSEPGFNSPIEEDLRHCQNTSSFKASVVIVATAMKSASALVCILLTVLLGVGIALIRPAQPVQVGMKAPFVVGSNVGLDNDAILIDSNIQPARKCMF